MVYNTSTKKVFAATFTFLFLFAISANAEGNTDRTYTLLEPLPCIPSETVKCETATGGSLSLIETVSMADFFQYAFNLFIALAAVAAVFMITYSGFEYVTTESWTGKSGAINKFKNAIYGLLMVLGSFLLLQTVNPKLVQFPTSIPAIQGVNRNLTSPDTYIPPAAPALAEIVQSQQEVKTLQQSRSELSAELNRLLDTPTSTSEEEIAKIQKINDLHLKIAQIDAQIKNEEADQVVSTTKANINNGVIQSTLNELKGEASKNTDSNPFRTANYNRILEIRNSGLNALNKIEETSLKNLVQVQAYNQMLQVNDLVHAGSLHLKLVAIKTIADYNIRQPGALNDIPIATTRKTLQTEIASIKGEMTDIIDPSLKEQITTILNQTELAVKNYGNN